jgi:DNA polymerase III alpha subunit (gram-positive type)
MDNYVIFDLETTGILDKDKGIYPEIVEIGATKYDKEGKVIGSFNKFIKPESYGHSKDPSSVYGWGGTAEKAAAESHKISWDTANEFGENKQSVLDEFYKFTEDSRVGGFNNNGFDNHVVEHHAGKPLGCWI